MEWQACGGRLMGARRRRVSNIGNLQDIFILAIEPGFKNPGTISEAQTQLSCSILLSPPFRLICRSAI